MAIIPILVKVLRNSHRTVISLKHSILARNVLASTFARIPLESVLLFIVAAVVDPVPVQIESQKEHDLPPLRIKGLGLYYPSSRSRAASTWKRAG
jgi:hypothetical protein